MAGLDEDLVRIGLIPHTLAETNLGDLGVGDEVNLEVDVVAKYVERMLPDGERLVPSQEDIG